MRGLVLGALLLCACQPARDLPLPVAVGDRTLLLIPLGASHLEVVDLEAPELLSPIAWGGSEPVLALNYPQSVAELQLQAGLVERPLAEPFRALPLGYTAYRAEFEQDPPAWLLLESAAAIEALAEVRLPALPVDVCESQGGCLRTEGGRLSCSNPCPSLSLPAPPRPPSPTVAPQLTPCGVGLEAQTSTLSPGVDRCVPLALECPIGSTRFLGETACQVEACPSDGWPLAVPNGAIYVDPLAGPGGDGSRAAPVQTILEAVPLAPAFGTLALRVGVHGPASIDRSLTLLGACRSGTIIDGGGRAQPSALAVQSVALEAQDLSVRGAVTGDALRLVRGAQVQLRSVDVAGRGPGGTILDAGTELSAERTRFSGPVQLLQVGRARLRLRASGLSGAAGRATCVGVASGGTVELEDVELSGCPSGGLTLNNAGLRGTRVVVRDFAGNGISLIGAATATISELVIQRGGNGLLASDRVKLVLSRFWGSHLSGRGLLATSSQVRLADVLVETTHERGVEITRSTLDAERLAIADARGAGLSMVEDQVNLSDLRVDRVRPVARGLLFTEGVGFTVSGQGTIERARVTLDRGAGVGVSRAPGAALNEFVLSDLEISSDLPNSDGTAFGVSGSNLSLDRISVHDWNGRAMSIIAGTLELSNAAFDCRPASNTASAIAISVIDTALRVRGLNLSGTASVGLQLQEGAGGTTIADLEDVVLERGQDGVGLRTRGLASGTHQLSLSRFRLKGAQGIGLDIDYVFYVQLHEGYVDDAKYGMRLDQPSFALEQLEDQVYFRGVQHPMTITCRVDNGVCGQ